MAHHQVRPCPVRFIRSRCRFTIRALCGTLSLTDAGRLEPTPSQ
jgi:hypothetical protein